jgi:hypothetical protein
LLKIAELKEEDMPMVFAYMERKNPPYRAGFG